MGANAKRTKAGQEAAARVAELEAEVAELKKQLAAKTTARK